MKVAVIGAGWLGKPLAERLAATELNVVASKRTQDACEALVQSGIEACVYELGQASLTEALVDADVYFINIPPGRMKQNIAEFQASMQQLISQCLTSQEKRLLFISTTSVYGEATKEVNEASEVEPITDSAQAHCAIENFIQTQYPKQATILRLAGLVGEDRHPAFSLANKKELTAAYKVVNLVHLEDVINAVQKIMEQKQWGQLYHLCAQEHPTRMEYYVWACEQLGLEPPTFFDPSLKPNTGKVINASETLSQLGLTLLYPSSFDMLRADK
ncbi:MAG: NAD(P)H-binding protein [Alteromonadaceae bacterium]|nr:NAD(P)H-binding protein [Alteromonadaceae bacterium]